jgi:putative transposase
MKRKISSDGFVLEKILYNSDEAQQLRYKFGNSYKFTLRYREDDLTRIWIHHPETHEMIEVPAVDQEYTTGINIYQHKMVLHLKQNARRDRVDRDEIADSKNTIREKIEADRISNSKVRRKTCSKSIRC